MYYPIGSIYETTDPNFSPSARWGGTWERIKGRVIAGVDESDPDFASAGLTFGEKKHTLIEAELPRISGSIYNIASADSSHPFSGHDHFSEYHIDTNVAGYGTTSSASANSLVFTFGSNGAHNNIQPTYTAYIWHRIA